MGDFYQGHSRPALSESDDLKKDDLKELETGCWLPN